MCFSFFMDTVLCNEDSASSVNYQDEIRKKRVRGEISIPM